MKGLYYERINGEPKATQERNLIEAHFTMSKGVGFLAWTRETNPCLIWELEPIPKPKKGILV